ncbi:MAG: hypothetical protein AB1765_03395 [Candidatus Hydrogenedentota bacterium]
MGMICKDIEIDGKKFWTLFDTGSRNNYILKKAASGKLQIGLIKKQSVLLGGKVHSVEKLCILQGFIRGYPIQMHARVLDEIGIDERGKEIEILFGALSMQEWGIVLVPEKEALDMSHYPKEFIEFYVREG